MKDRIKQAVVLTSLILIIGMAYVGLHDWTLKLYINTDGISEEGVQWCKDHLIIAE